ncbi:glycosyltransferase family 39 protein, partial [Candidatus Microgenomates bacterium]|nr:glycosyltransferase family 39 protein [Candidatus Microgenomates bacterium]
YKPPLYTYLTVLPVWLFGLNEFSTRFISAFLGFLTVVVSYFLIKELFPAKKYDLYLLFTFLFAISPWHIQFSRVAFEANCALFFFVTGTWLFLKGLKSGLFFLASFLSFGLSAYAYHSPRLIVPIFLFGLGIIFRKEIKTKITFFAVSVLLISLLFLPIILVFGTSTAARFGSVSVINPNEKLGESIKAIELDNNRGDFFGKFTHNRRIVFGREILAGYLDHFNFAFLFLTGDPPGRHHAAGMGMLYLVELPFIIIGLIYMLRNFSRGMAVILLWFLLAPLASSLTSGTPHAVRALLYLPTYQLITAFGLLYVFGWLSNNLSYNRSRLIKTLIFIAVIGNFFYYLHMYYVHTPIEYSYWWQYGYKEAVAEVAKIEKNYDKVFVTYQYDQPYIYFLFYNQVDPAWYQKNWGGGEVMREQRSFGKYVFRDLDWDEDSEMSKVILMGTASEIPEGASGLVKTINYPDGSVAFRLVAR